MAEYIEKEAALQIIDYAKQLTSEQIVRESGTYELLSDTGKACYDGIIAALAMCKQLINECVRAADVQPVRRGKWIAIKNGAMQNWKQKCSVCGDYHRGKTNYCGNCGADMRGED